MSMWVLKRTDNSVEKWIDLKIDESFIVHMVQLQVMLFLDM